MGANLFHADGRTAMTKLVVAFRKSVNTPKNLNARSGQNVELINVKPGSPYSNQGAVYFKRHSDMTLLQAICLLLKMFPHVKSLRLKFCCE